GNPDACTQCLRQNANTPGNGGCGAGNYCNAAAICAPCTTATFCGPSCIPCNGSTPVCATIGGLIPCVECQGDSDRRVGQKCNISLGKCQECTSNADCPRGKTCNAAGACEACSTDDACASASCNCCGAGNRCLVAGPGANPSCAQCVKDLD